MLLGNIQALKRIHRLVASESYVLSEAFWLAVESLFGQINVYPSLLLPVN